MYKIFFKDRIVFLTDKIDNDLSRDFGAIHKLGSDGELKQFVNHFESNEDRKEAFIYHHNQHELLKRFRGLFKNLPAAGGLIWNQDKSHFLSMERLGKADLPKGKIEINETFEEAALREVSEECGIEHPEITRPLGSTFHTYELDGEKILKEVRWFEMIYHGSSTPTPQLEENITHIRWTPKSEGKEFIKHTYPSVIEILKKADII
ncbi:NUDIX hydrolase [Marinilabilia rubra]|uniref:NUDIX hydrolase n=1 Tax=Marinilabilia rubra TaxID=2162893 RepID=A0A2U2BDL9_9BACT|nr:NUDIX domain-containing protein [Marinilabilia rubra]PWE01160.1 NUDIX hydrolase [Marinilabilia rubra]